MKKYYFSDWDEAEQQEQDLQGEGFDTLLETCLGPIVGMNIGHSALWFDDGFGATSH